MSAQLELIAVQIGVSVQTLVIVGISLGALLLYAGVISLFRDRNVAADRLAESQVQTRTLGDKALLRGPEFDPKGLMKNFVPADREKRTQLQAKLSQAGYPQAGALRNFTFVRMLLGVVLPGLLVGLIVVSRYPGLLPADLSATLGRMTNLKTIQVLTVLVAIGYFLPVMWLNGRVTERRLRIEEGFPNSLNLMQISVEAGLGFDAAMTRVGNELATVSPDIAYEFLTVQRQVQAGRDRDRAMRDMSDRTGVETVRSFSNVVQQSMQFGTPMSSALTTYSKEMREYRELKAQEMANKLPVKMSAVLASLMLPALILLTVGPVIIRYARYFGG